LQFPYEYFLLVLLPLGVTVVNFVLQTTPWQKTQKLRSGKRAGQILLFTILSPKTSDKDCRDIRAVWTVAESCWNQP
jgi:hypothetical protein